ncbi:MAG: DUF6531 domain-containing protein [Aquisalimonadaceae bacterium]
MDLLPHASHYFRHLSLSNQPEANSAVPAVGHVPGGRGTSHVIALLLALGVSTVLPFGSAVANSVLYTAELGVHYMSPGWWASDITYEPRHFIQAAQCASSIVGRGPTWNHAAGDWRDQANAACMGNIVRGYKNADGTRVEFENVSTSLWSFSGSAAIAQFSHKFIGYAIWPPYSRWHLSQKSYEELYFITLPDDPQSSRACTAGNPVDVATGAKYQREADITGPVPFTRYYASSTHGAALGEAPWRHGYEYTLEVLGLRQVSDGAALLRSAGHARKADACHAGWLELQPRLSAPWATGATAEYDETTEICRILHGGTLMKHAAVTDVVALPPQVEVVQLTRPSGAVLRYQQAGSGWTTLGAHTGRLEQPGDGTWRFIADDDTVERYSADGRLLSITARDGHTRSFDHDGAGRLRGIQDAAGHGLQFAYEGDLLASVTADGDEQHRFAYDPAGRLERVQRPDGTARHYHYEDARFPEALTGLTDENGHRYATWAYDDQGRAVRSEHAEGAERTELAYNADGTTTVTNALGKQTTYHFAPVQGVRRVSRVEGHATAGCEGAYSDYTYTPEGWLETRTDWNGTRTRFEYNARGLEVRRIEAEGSPAQRETRTDWHPSLRLPVRITEAGRTTELDYDSRGRLTRRSEQAH